VLFDKTGTLTAGRPRLATIEIGPVEEPGAVDQGTLHSALEIAWRNKAKKIS
jgi:cation transport ATPase